MPPARPSPGAGSPFPKSPWSSSAFGIASPNFFFSLCKHVAATLYGIGARLDHSPELLFTLRKVDHLDLIGGAAAGPALLKARGTPKDRVLEGADLSGIFGIDLDQGAAAPPRTPAGTRRGPTARPRGRGKTTVAARDLVRRGIPHGTIQSWLRAGVLVHSGRRGVYRTTAETEPRIAAYLARGTLDAAPVSRRPA